MRRFESYYPCQIPKNGASYEAPFFFRLYFGRKKTGSLEGIDTNRCAFGCVRQLSSEGNGRTAAPLPCGLDYLSADGRMRLFTSTLFFIMPFSSRNAWSFSREAMSASVSVS